MEFQISELSDLRRQLKEELDATAKQSEYLIELAAFTDTRLWLKLGTLYAISLGEWGGEIPLEAMECAVNAVRLLKTSILDILGNVPMNRDDKVPIEVINKMQQLPCRRRVDLLSISAVHTGRRETAGSTGWRGKIGTREDQLVIEEG